MLTSLGTLRVPYVAAASAIIALAVIFFAHDADRSAAPMAIVSGLVVGVLFAVTLYAVMRSLASRPRSLRDR